MHSPHTKAQGKSVSVWSGGCQGTENTTQGLMCYGKRYGLGSPEEGKPLAGSEQDAQVRCFKRFCGVRCNEPVT